MKILWLLNKHAIQTQQHFDYARLKLNVKLLNVKLLNIPSHE